MIAASGANDEIRLAMIVGDVINILGACDHQVAHHEIIKHVFEFGLNFIKNNGVEINVLPCGYNKFVTTLSSRKLTFIIKIDLMHHFPIEMTLLIFIKIFIIK